MDYSDRAQVGNVTGPDGERYDAVALTRLSAKGRVTYADLMEEMEAGHFVAGRHDEGGPFGQGDFVADGTQPSPPRRRRRWF